MKIVFFGASVTAQKDGYVDKVSQLLPSDISVHQHGYGSMHLNDAGICFLSEVVEKKPAVCFLDWFSTAYISIDTLYLDTIVRTLRMHGCAPVFLFFPRADLTDERLALFARTRAYAHTYSVPICDLVQIRPTDKLFRDGVHTTSAGATVFAKHIVEWFTGQFLPPATAYSVIRTLAVAGTSPVCCSKIIIRGRGVVIGVFMKVGPYTGCVSVNGVRVVLWDQWCHYERNTMKLSGIEVDGTTTIDVCTSTEIDRSACKVQLNWLEITQNLQIYKFFYSGDLSFDIENQ